MLGICLLMLEQSLMIAPLPLHQAHLLIGKHVEGLHSRNDWLGLQAWGNRQGARGVGPVGLRLTRMAVVITIHCKHGWRWGLPVWYICPLCTSLSSCQLGMTERGNTQTCLSAFPTAELRRLDCQKCCCVWTSSRQHARLKCSCTWLAAMRYVQSSQQA